MAAPLPSSPFLPQATSSRRPHRKRVSVSRLSSDTTATLPPYRSNNNSISGVLDEQSPRDQPPDYPDSAEEADEESETDDHITQLISPPVSPRPRRRKLFASSSSSRSGTGTGLGYQHRSRVGSLYADPRSQSDIFLDRILERSVAALELSNTLLQSSMSTQSSLSTVLSPPSPEADESLHSQARTLSERIRGNNHARWMDDLDVLAKDVEALFDDCKVNGVDIPGHKNTAKQNSPDEMVSRSLPATSNIRRPRRSLTSLRGQSDNGGLRLTTSNDRRIFSSPVPRAMTQFVNADAEFGCLPGSSSDMKQSILLPSTLGLRSSSTLTNFSSPVSPPPLQSATSSSPAYASLVRQASRSPRRPSRSPSASGSSSRTYRQRSSSRSSSNQAPSPHLLPRIIPPPIEELPSQSDSSSSDSPHPLRTVESLRKILDEQPPMQSRQSENRLAPHPPPTFLPRSPPVSPVLGTSSTTTSISRLYTKGSHSTSTRPRSPPRHSSLKRRPPPLETDPSSSTTSISSLRSPLPPHSSATSSGRSTPRSVAFGPLPEPIRPDGAPSRFKEQREAKAKAKKARSRSSSRASGKEAGRGKGKEIDSEESSWWTTWLTGGSSLSMSTSKAEERAEDRIARSWGRPSMFEEWPV